MTNINGEKTYNLRRMLSAGIFISALLSLTMVLPIYANNIQVANVSLTGQNASEDYTHVQFDLSWYNSWRTSSAPNNWDAAWVFVKYKKTGENTWNHAYLNTSAANHTVPTGYECSVGTTDGNGIGVFIYRSSDGTGTASLSDVQLRWEYGANGIADDNTVTVKVFAIEMVYIPVGNFYVGDGSSTDRFHDGDNNSESFQVTSSQITFGTDNGELWSIETSGDYWDLSENETLQTSFPTGYDDFYCMKYEISQGQYADFLSLLTDAQDDNRYPNQNGSYRHTISGSYGNYSASVSNRACNYLSWADGAAYADWAGLRPMTELEFEKACRGTVSATGGEYAWGDTTIHDSAYTITNDGQLDATVDNSTTAGNASYSPTDGDINGPLRCGIFADGGSDRQEAGASYYGVMEMSGNLWERPVTVGNSDGRAFTGTHGDGSLDVSGDADVVNWPGTNAEGAGFRGGVWGSVAADLRVSDRYNAANPLAIRNIDYGFRGVRSAP